MAQCKQTPQEFIKNAFTPQVAVMCTPLAEKCCQKNNLNFIELLQPFSRLYNDVHYKDPSGLTISIHNFKITFLDITWRPPQTAVARKLLNSSVSNAPESRTKTVQVDKYQLDIPASTPWYEAWRETFLRVQYPSDHEFTKHFLSCILVVSSADNNPTETFVQLCQSLNQIQNTTPGKLPKWFSSNILKYYVIVHDITEGDTNIANKAFESIKSSYGIQNCFLLRMNSRPFRSTNTEHLPDPWSQFISNQIELQVSKGEQENIPNNIKTSFEIGQEAEEVKNSTNYHPLSPVTEDFSLGDIGNDEDKPKNPTKPIQHGGCLSTDDVEQVKLLVYEFVKSCLLPYIERQISILNDMVSNKKGVSKSLFSATKRWFSPSKPGASSVAVNNLIYAPDSPELQIRRLGDLYFMFGHYSLAFQAYHLAKRDYNTDQAWLYYAGALEMASLSAFMANECSRKTYDYMEESITTYLNTCKMPQFATRSTILSADCLKHQSMFGEAAHQLIRMTSEESDLRSALLLEQAAYCFLQSKMFRKYSFHMVLSGHRFSKAAQRKHSLKCYKQAYQVYENTGWDLACDHIHYTIGRQANNLQHFDEAVESFSKLLKGGSKQSAQQQALFLKEYLTILGSKLKTESEADQLASPILPVPELNSNSIKVLVGPTRPLSTPGKIPAMGIHFSTVCDGTIESKWNKLEEMLVQEAEGSLPLLFKPSVTLHNISKLDKTQPIAIVNEPIQVSLELANTLQTGVYLKDIHLLWTFCNENNVISNETNTDKIDSFVKTYIAKTLTLDGNTKQDVILTITPLVTGIITISGFCYILTGSNTASETSFIKGKKLINIPENNGQPNIQNDSNKRLEIKVVPPAPCLHVTFSEMNLEFLTDEIEKVTVDFRNTSTVPLQNIYMATSVPHLLSYNEFNQLPINSIDFNNMAPALKEKLIRKNHITSVPLPGNILEPSQATTINIWIKAPGVKGPAAIDLLIYYENVDRTSIPRYRLVRHSWNLAVEESLAVDVSTQASHNSKSVEELAFAMKITNVNKVHSSVSTQVTLLNVGLLSKNWSLTRDTTTLKFITLHAQESAHILLKAKRTVKRISEYSSISLSSDISHPNLTNTLTFAKKAERPLQNLFNGTECIGFKEYKDGVLLLQWQALVIDANSKRISKGQNHIPVEINRKEEDIFQLERILCDNFIDINEKSVTEEDNAEIAQKQVSYNLVYPPVVKHNFQKEKMCIVPVKLLLHSIVDNKDLSVAVNTTEACVPVTTINKSNLFYTHAFSNFSWLGNSKIIKTLKPLTTDTVQLAVVVTGPGTYNLGAHIQILCTQSHQSEPFVPQSCQIYSALIVVNISS